MNAQQPETVSGVYVIPQGSIYGPKSLPLHPFALPQLLQLGFSQARALAQMQSAVIYPGILNKITAVFKK